MRDKQERAIHLVRTALKVVSQRRLARILGLSQTTVLRLSRGAIVKDSTAKQVVAAPWGKVYDVIIGKIQDARSTQLAIETEIADHFSIIDEIRFHGIR